MQTRLLIQLSAFMFLQYYIWGSWYASLGAYLANTFRFGGHNHGRLSLPAASNAAEEKPPKRRN
jgi:hypothetical protein